MTQSTTGSNIVQERLADSLGASQRPVVEDRWTRGATRSGWEQDRLRSSPPMPTLAMTQPTTYETAPTINAVASGAATLELGQQGPAVTLLQNTLNKLGATPALAPSGKLDRETMAALQAFQEANGISVDEQGFVGPQTVAAFGAQMDPADLDVLRNRAVAMDAIALGQVRSVGRKAAAEITDEDIDLALEDADWTPQPQGAVDGVVPLSQSDSNARLGNGRLTIRQAGCMLTSYTMAATGLTGNHELTPKAANDLVKSAHGFSGSSLIGPTAARALGMEEVERTGVHKVKNDVLVQKIDDALANGQVVVLGVDYKKGSHGTSNGTGVDHWITVTGKDEAGNYTAIDPVGGRPITLSLDEKKRLTGAGWSGGTTYVGKEAVLLRAA